MKILSKRFSGPHLLSSGSGSERGRSTSFRRFHVLFWGEGQAVPQGKAWHKPPRPALSWHL